MAKSKSDKSKTKNNTFVMKALSGAHAVAEAMRQINPDVVAAYPITPQTPIVEKFSEFVANGEVDTEFVPVESEHSAMSVVIGASAAGARAMTATSSVGLALMFEVVNAASGMRLPIVMNVANRALSSPINIHCDHSDSMACRDAGWIQLYSEDAQEAYENTIFAIRLSEHEDIQLPTMVMQDGFITSHSVQNVDVLQDDVVRKFVGERRAKHALLSGKAITYGPLALPDYFFEIKRQQEEGMRNAYRLFPKIAKEFGRLVDKDYGFFEFYHVDDAETVLIALNSTAGTAKVVADKLRGHGNKVGVLKLRVFRPFPYKEVADVLRDVKNVIVLDRSMSFGAIPPLAGEFMKAFYDYGVDVNFQNYVYGLGGREITEKEIAKLFRNANKRVRNGFVGLRE